MTGGTKMTSKNQVTIPSKIAREAGLKKGARLTVSIENGNIVLKPTLKLIDDLAGSVKVPKELRGKDLNEVRRQASTTYFRKRGRP